MIFFGYRARESTNCGEMMEMNQKKQEDAAQRMDVMALAADSGGTKTDWLLVDQSGQERFRLKTSGMAAVREGLLPVDDIVKEAAAALKARGTVGAVYVSLGGPNGNEVEMAIRNCWPDVPIVVEREARALAILEYAKTKKCQAVVMCGTGSTAAGYTRNGLRYAGGWGPTFGDGGSGGGLGSEALKYFLFSLDEHRSLEENSDSDTVSRCGHAAFEALFADLTAGVDSGTFDGRMIIKERALSLSRAELAAMAPALYELYDQGNGIAAMLYQKQAEEIAKLAAHVSDDDPDFRILLCGGFFTNKPKLMEDVHLCLKKFSRAELLYDPEFAPIDAFKNAALALLRE